MARRVLALARIALRELRARKGRTLLSCASLVVGILAITVVEGTSAVAGQYLVAQAEMKDGRQGSAVMTVQSSPAGVATTLSLLRSARAGVSSLVMVSDTGADLRSAQSRVPLVGYAGQLRQIRPFRLLAGRWPSAGPALVPEIFVNEHAAPLMPVGSYVRLCESAGSCAAKGHVVGSVLDGELEGRAYVGWSDLLRRSGTGADGQITVYARGSGGRPGAGRAWLIASAARIGTPVREPARDIDSTAGLTELLRTIRLAFLVVGAVTLLVGVLGVLNIGLATLRERAEELALRRSLGATPGDIATLVLIEVVFIGLASSVVSILVPLLGFHPVVRAVLGPNAEVAMPLGAVAVGVVAGFVAGLLGGLIPAVRAARMSIASVMRA